MKSILKKIYKKFNLFFRIIDPVINIKNSARAIINYFSFIKDYKTFNKISQEKIRLKDLYPCLLDKTAETPFDRHYIYHPAWAARILAITKPKEHIDISSTLTFCTMISAFIPVKFYDFRPAQLNLSDLYCGTADLTQLPFEDNSIDSLSCMHTVEHIGLGRYGDPINPAGDLQAISELKRVVKPGGHLLFVVPVGKLKIMFNGHRIYSFEQIEKYFEGFEIRQFALVLDNKELGIINPADPKLVADQEYGCDCFWFVKSIMNN